MKKFGLVLLLILVVYIVLKRDDKSIKPATVSIVKKQSLHVEKSKALPDVKPLAKTEKIANDRVDTPVMSDEEFMRLEIENAKKYLEESEIVYCNKKDTIHYKETRNKYQKKILDEDPICLTIKKYCSETKGRPSDPELLEIMTPHEIVEYLIRRENTKRYIEDPLSDYEAVNERYFQRVLEELSYLDQDISSQ